MASIPKLMQAVVYRGPNDLRLETVPVPRIGSAELLVKVAACGVCPTDIKKIQYGTVPAPRIFGHETAGTIVRVGARVKGFQVGDRVALHHHVPCLKCHYCRHKAFAQCPGYKKTGVTAGFEPAGGGFAEYVRVMSFAIPGVVKIPRRNTFIEGAMLEPVNTVLKAVKKLALLPGDTAWVVGQGPIGLLFTRILSLEGVSVLATDLMKNRLTLARRWGARWVLDAAQDNLVQKITRLAPMLDASVLAVPAHSALEQALSAVRGSGKVMLFAHTKRGDNASVDLAQVCVDEKDLLGSYSSDFTLQGEVAKLVFSRQVDVTQLVTDECPLSQTSSAVTLASHPGPTSLKVVITQS